MRSRLVALGILAVLLGSGSVGMAYAGVQLQYAGQRIGLVGSLTPGDFQRQQFDFVSAFALQSMVAPLAAAGLLAVAAILAVLARRRQLRRRRFPRQ